ncbi:MAG: alpha-L-fucosidase, partial [Planctomycetota bacterium]
MMVAARCCAFLVFACAFFLLCLTTLGEEILETDAPAKELKEWQAMRFGMFIHWGPVSLKGTEIGWSRGDSVPIEEYDSLYKRFDPTRFDAKEWVSTARQAGMKYMVLTTKHHDGFCLWDTKETEYNIMNTPFGRDVVKELAAACRDQGMAFGAYYSVCDWHHPDYGMGSPGGRTEKPDPDMDRYQAFLQNQLKELSDRYGPLITFWFDGQWEKPWTCERGEKLYAFCRQLDPRILINNRVGKARSGMGGTSVQSAGYPGHYDTPEQRIGAFNNERPWETCMTLCRQWSWKPDDEMKSFKECIRTLALTAGGDGNLLFNVGPMPDGRIESRQKDRLKEIGTWLAKYGTSIYGTRGGPFYPGSWG